MEVFVSGEKVKKIYKKGRKRSVRKMCAAAKSNIY